VRRFIDQATAVLHESLDYHETIEQLAKLVVPDLADWCVVDLVEGDRLRNAAVVHSDGEKVARAHEFAERHAPDPDCAFGWSVVRSGKAVLLSEADIERYIAGLAGPLGALLRDLGVRSWLAAPLVAHEHPLGVIHLIMSDPSRRHSELDLETATELGQRAGAAIENARLHRDAQDAVQLRERVLAVVSHDLRNPLNAIEIGAQLIEQQTREPHTRKHVEAIRRSSKRMEQLILDLLDIANINAGRFAMQRTSIDAGELVSELVEMYEPLAADRGITLASDGDVRGARLSADRNRLVQAFGNLLGNALKVCSRGDTITIGCAREGDRVGVSVTDTGPGIPAEDIPNLFKAFWSKRIGGERNATNGLGMGLYITKAIVEAHDGTIAAERSEAGGARFTVSLPIAKRA
jgi:signal transduction histidine kinase